MALWPSRRRREDSSRCRRSVTEGGRFGQHRIEIDTRGPAQSYMLHVLQAKDTDSPDLAASVEETEDEVRLRLSHPTRGTAVATFEKGMHSEGGSFGFAAEGEPTPAPLAKDIQGMTVTDAGPVWHP